MSVVPSDGPIGGDRAPSTGGTTYRKRKLFCEYDASAVSVSSTLNSTVTLCCV